MRSWGLMRNLIGRYMHRGREKAVANTPHFTIIFTVFYFIQNHVDTRRKTLHLLLPLPPTTRPSPTHPLPKVLLLVLYFIWRNLIGRYIHRGREKAVANTPHFTIIFTVFYFIQNHSDARRKTLHLLLPLPPPT